jgi:pyridoxal phosphate enzyme (YggS family)
MAAGTSIFENLQQVREQIKQAADRAGVGFETIRIVAVTKFHKAQAIREACQAGIREFGENYAQEMVEKHDTLNDLHNVEWHFIGHLQSNKVPLVVGRCALIQTVDSLKLAQRIDREAADKHMRQDILIQVRLGHEETKSGTPADRALELAESLSTLTNVRLSGIMGVAPLGVDARPYFAQLRDLYERLPANMRRILSMGMSADYQSAILEGTNMLRIGTALLGNRPVTKN